MSTKQEKNTCRVPARYIIGIDLGTTNSVLAYSPVDTKKAEVQLLEIPQLTAPGTTEELASLPSFVYLCSEGEQPGEVGGLTLPDFQREAGAIVGEYARRRAAKEPERTIHSVKSWLCHNRVDRRSPILPEESTEKVIKRSPVEITRILLEYLAAAWNGRFPDDPLCDQKVVLTVPASFDASARELTREAALLAGFNEETLVFLEEPQAAIYSWLGEKGEHWRKELNVGDILLVCDVGGGTSDFSLVRVEEEQGDLILNRLAVGNHLLVGGDNMDLALANRAAELFAEKGVNLNPWQSVALWHSCRTAKEVLLAAGITGSTGSSGKSVAETHPVAIPGRGSRLIGGSVSVDFPKADASGIVLDGFFPLCSLTDKIKRNTVSGFRQLGLPFEQETGITRHLAAFLRVNGVSAPTETSGENATPTCYLLNGGVFKADSVRDRLNEQLEKWFPDHPPRNINESTDLDRSVARGAAVYGFTKEHGGVRIRGASARAYYVGIESAGLAIPGRPRPIKALCVAPIGMEEGTECDVPVADIGLVVGESALFRFFSSTSRREDKPGTLLDQNHIDSNDPETPPDLQETDPIETSFSPEKEDEEGEFVPVQFQTRITELGVMEVWCQDTQSPRRWKLEFSVREE